MQFTRGKAIIGAIQRAVRTTTTASTLKPGDLGNVLLVNAAASRTTTLPSAALAKGASVTVINQIATTSGAGHLVKPSGTEQVIGNGFTAANGKGAVNTQATSKAGDSITLTSDGTAWYVTAVTGTWAREA